VKDARREGRRDGEKVDKRKGEMSSDDSTSQDVNKRGPVPALTTYHLWKQKQKMGQVITSTSIPPHRTTHLHCANRLTVKNKKKQAAHLLCGRLELAGDMNGAGVFAD
jgi:hypothetical protein